VKPVSTIAATLLTLTLFASFTFAQDKASAKVVDPSGTWRWEYELGGQTFKDSLRVNLGSDNKVVGYYQGREKPVEVKEAKYDDNVLSFLLNLDYQGTPIKLQFKGKVNGDEIDGSVAVTTGEGTQDFPWAPKRSVQMEDVVGQWQIKIETGDRTLEPIVTITKEGEQYKAKYVSGQELNVEATDLKIEKNELCFKVSATVNGTQVKADYKGRPYGDKIKGSIAYVLGDNSGDIDFTGVRKNADAKP
jgi:hypothetical protein